MRGRVTLEEAFVIEESGGWEGVRGDGCSGDRVTRVPVRIVRRGMGEGSGVYLFSAKVCC